MEPIECAGGIVTNSEGGVLIVRNQIGKFTFPKGTRKPGEYPVDTALREIGEESGLRLLKLERYLGTLTRPGFTAEVTDEPSVIKAIEMFHYTTTQLSLCPLSRDVVAAHWVHPESVPDNLSWPEETQFFRERHPLLV